MKFFTFVTLLMVGCGRVDVSDSHHTVSGDATIHVVVGVDVTACQGLEPAAKAECIQSLIELAKVMTETQQVDQPTNYWSL